MAEVVECRLQRAVHRLQVVGDPACRVGLLQKIVNLAQELVRIEVRRAKAEGGYAAEGFTSTGAWLACHSGLSGEAARAVVRQAAELPHLPHSQTAAERGLLHEQQIRLLVECRRADPDRYDADTDAAFAALPITELILAARAWKAAAADRRHDPTKPAGAPPETATVHLSQLLDGRWRLDGTLNPHDGTLLNQALDQAIARQLQARRNGDPSVEGLSIGSMRAQGLVDLAAQALRDHPGNRSRNGRYRINLVVRPSADGTTIEPDRPFPPEAWCDAAWARIIMGAEGDILDIGRATRDWPEAIWNAIAQRDSPTATAPPTGATPTTAPPGNTAATPAPPTASSSADATTSSSTPTTGPSNSTNTNNPSSDNPTAPPTNPEAEHRSTTNMNELEGDPVPVARAR